MQHPRSSVPPHAHEGAPPPAADGSPSLDPYLRYMAHELRNAHGAVLGWANVLRRSAAGTPLLAQGMEAIDRNVRLQSALLEDLLDGARLCQGELPLDVERLRPGEVVAQVLVELEPIAMRAEVRLRAGVLDATASVLADEARLKRMVASLVRSALEVTARGSALSIGVQPAGGDVEIRVADAAIDAGERHVEQLEGAIEPDSAPRSLLLVAALARLQRGRLDVHGDGSDARCDFRLRLPRL